jgi:hypothetical protein
MKRLTQLPDSDCEQSHYIEIMQAAIFVFFVWTSEQLLKMKKRRLNEFSEMCFSH